MRNARLRFWLLALDACAALGLYGTAPYLFVLRRASDAIEYEPAREDRDAL